MSKANLIGKFVEMQGQKSRPTRGKQRKFISVYAIARNESKFAERWYNCVKEADEVCVLVNNTTDDTAKILSSLGANVTVKDYSEWRFDIARNDSLSLVSPKADILFTLDLDETIAPGWRKVLESTWIKAEDSGKDFQWGKYSEVLTFKDDGSPKEIFPVYKIHRPNAAVWTHRIHETPLVDETKTIPIPIQVEHHPDNAKDRSYYLSLMEQEYNDNPTNPRSAFFLGREYLCVGRYSDAIKVIAHYLSLPLSNPRESAFAFYYLALAFGYLGDRDKEMQYLWQANLFAPECREFVWVLILRAYERKSFWEVVCLCRLMEAKNATNEILYTESKDASGAKFYMLYAEALWQTASFDKALEMSAKAVALEPDNSESVSFRKRLLDTYKKNYGAPPV